MTNWKVRQEKFLKESIENFKNLGTMGPGQEMIIACETLLGQLKEIDDRLEFSRLVDQALGNR